MKAYKMLLFTFFALIISACDIFEADDNSHPVFRDGPIAFILNSSSKTISKVSLVDPTTDNFFISLDETSSALKFDIEGENIWVAATEAGSIKKYSTKVSSTSPLTEIFLEDSSAPNSIVIYDGFAYVSANNLHKVFRVDIATGEKTSVKVGNNPQGLAISSSTNRLFVANSDWSTNASSTISIIDLNNFEQESKTIEIGEEFPQTFKVIDDKLYVVCSKWGNPKSKVVRCNLDGEIVDVIEVVGSCFSITEFDQHIYLNRGEEKSGLAFFHRDSTQVHYKELGGDVFVNSLAASDNYFALTHSDGTWGSVETLFVYFKDLETKIRSVQVGVFASDIHILE